MAKQKDAAEGTAGEEKKSKMGLLIIMVLVLLLLGGGGVAVWLFVLRTPPPTAEELAAAQVATKKKEPEILPVFALRPFVVNLADKNARRYLKVSMKLELSNEDLVDEMEKRRAQVRDVILTLLSSKTAKEVSSMEGKFLLRQDIIKRVNTFLVAGKVTHVYWEEFVVQ